MPAIPKNPDEFFTIWLPQSLAPLGSKLPSPSSLGAVVFHVGARPSLAVRLRNGALEATPGLPDDAIVQVSLSEADFEPILVRGAERMTESADPAQMLAVLRALTLDRERVALIREVVGSVAFVLAVDGGEHRVVLTPGVAARNVAAPECTVRCALDDFLALQRGDANPFELMMNGKIQISGDAQIPMALSSLLV
jgi:putative sterol carrier protein